MNKIVMIFIMMLIPSMVMAQEDGKDENLVDEHALATTVKYGEIGIGETPMSIYATPGSLNTFIKNNEKQAYFVFPEHRENAIRLLDGLPEIWTKRTKEERSRFTATVRPGEYFTFQMGVYAFEKELVATHYKATDLKDLSCFNLEGIDYLGSTLKKTISIAKGKVQPLWFGIQIPKGAKGTITGKLTLNFEDVEDTVIEINLNITGDDIQNSGFDDGDRLSRMAWLNSTIAQDDEVTSGYVPIKIEGNRFNYLGREVEIAKNGLPKSINTYFDAGNQHLKKKSEPILSDGIRFIIVTAEGKKIRLESEKPKFFNYPGASPRGIRKEKTLKFRSKPRSILNLDYRVKRTAATIAWEVKNHSDAIDVIVQAEAEFDGFLGYRIKVVPKKDIKIKDIRLEIPLTKDKSTYLMGMGKEGGFRPETYQWKWDVANKSQDAIWVGGVNGGIRLKLKGANYHRQLVNIYYKFGPLARPVSWENQAKGGCDIRSTKKGALVKAYSGERTLQEGSVLHFDFDLLVTPVKLINKDIQFNDRYYHSSTDVSDDFIEKAKRAGANIINIHHRTDINPFINYPYLPENVAALSKFVKDAHTENIRTKVYYTTRELTVNTPEIWAFRSLNGEVIFPGPGKNAKTVINKTGPHPWLTKNFKEDFIPAWKTTFNKGKYKGRQDLSVITTPDSRLNNFYLEGLDWMCKNIEIDGIYIDDSALDRQTLKRARKILDRNRPNARIDMHSWNHFNKLAGHACSLNLYMDLLPYYDLLWIGEGRDYDRSPDYWLVETSGIPFGLTSQMLQKGGNRWRGMVFGITNRLGWHGPNPEHIWKFWDEHQIQTMDMLGFWDANCPVKTNDPNLVATLYKGKNKAIIAVANWTDKTQQGQIVVDWKKLGILPSEAKFRIPALKEYQEEIPFSLQDNLEIEGGKGFLIVVEY